MKLTLTPAEMLGLWRLHHAYGPLPADALFTRTDGIDTDAVFTAEMNLWYRKLLLEAPPPLLAPRSLAPSLSFPEEGCAVAELPEGTLRVLDVRLSSWSRSPLILTDPSSPLLGLQLHRFTRATAASPVAFFHGSELRLWPAVPSDRLVTLSCAVCEDGVYEFDDSVLATLHPE